MSMLQNSLLEIRNLTVSFNTRSGPFLAVDGVNLTVDRNEVVSIVGESGSGKSVAMLAVMGLLPWTATITADVMRFEGLDLLTLSDRERRRTVRRDIAMIFQEPMTSLNPCFTVGFQIGESLKTHLGLDRAACRRGMSQRVMIAMALASQPKLLIADEPTTALDVTIQAQILDLLMSIQRDNGMGLVLITHDMGVVAETAQRVVVQYAGQQVEMQDTIGLFQQPRHPYTAALLAALPERAAVKGVLPSIPGVVPGQFDKPVGCLFSPRCAFASPLCRATPPKMADAAHAHALCHTPLQDGQPVTITGGAA